MGELFTYKMSPAVLTGIIKEKLESSDKVTVLNGLDDEALASQVRKSYYA